MLLDLIMTAVPVMQAAYDAGFYFMDRVALVENVEVATLNHFTK